MTALRTDEAYAITLLLKLQCLVNSEGVGVYDELLVNIDTKRVIGGFSEWCESIRVAGVLAEACPASCTILVLDEVLMEVSNVAWSAIYGSTCLEECLG